MHLTITGRNMDVTPALREYAEEKIGKIDKYLQKITSAHVILAVEKYRHIAEVTIQVHGLTLKGVEETGDMYSSIDQVMDKIETQAHKLHDRLKDKNKSAVAESEVDAAEDAFSGGAGSPPRVVPGKRFNPKPMTVEEAVLQLETSGDLFIVFLEARSNKVDVLYRRGDTGEYGLIETT